MHILAEATDSPSLVWWVLAIVGGIFSTGVWKLAAAINALQLKVAAIEVKIDTHASHEGRIIGLENRVVMLEAQCKRNEG